MADRPTHARGDGAPVTFFGRQTRVPAGAAHFALKTGAPVVVVAVLRTPRNTYTALALPPLHFSNTDDPKQDVVSAMQRIIEDVEHVIRANPDQWYMFRRMWPDTPAHGDVAPSSNAMLTWALFATGTWLAEHVPGSLIDAMGRAGGGAAGTSSQ